MSKQQTLAEINNNPLNIRYNPQNQWRGQTGQNKGFCVFKNNAFGFRAGFIILGNYIKNGINTIEQIISRWAPPSENNTENYIRFIENECIIPRNLVLTDMNIHDYWTKIIILQAMAQMESGIKIDENQINLYINYPEKY